MIFVCFLLFFFFFCQSLPMVIFISSQYLAPIGGTAKEETKAGAGPRDGSTRATVERKSVK